MGEHLRAHRLDTNTPIQTVTEQLGISAETLRNWEHDTRTPTVTKWPAIIAFLGYDPNPRPQTLAEHSLAYRRRTGLTQEELAEHLSLDPSTVLRVESGYVPRWPRIRQRFESLTLEEKT